MVRTSCALINPNEFYNIHFCDFVFIVCPANWDPEKNADTIKPDVSGSKEYFNKH